MIPKPVQIGVCALLVLGLLGLVVVGIQSCNQGKESRLELKASEAKGRADGHAQAATGEAVQAKAAGLQDDLAKNRVAQLETELAALKRTVATPSKPKVPSMVPEPDPGMLSPLVVDLAPVIAKQDEIIQAQKVQIVAAEAKAFHWEQAYHESDAAFKAERDRSLKLEMALEAQKVVSKASLWRGRVGGVVIGFGAGFLAGRLH